MWSAIVHDEERVGPCNRSKHSITLLGNYLYLLGGKNGNMPLKDLWRYSLDIHEWELLNPRGDLPPSLQDHTAVSFSDYIYVFGGELGFSADNETPLWIYGSKENSWRKLGRSNGVNVPKGRRGHTTLVYRDSALVYGGYCDLRGSSNELWVFHFDTESWHLLINGKTDPPARHKHSSVVHNDSMWVYGGMTDLQERSDLWRFDIITRKWFSVKCKMNPGPLHSHVACKLPSSMLLFGGERNGQLINELWRFHFGTETWQQIQINAIIPQPVSELCAVAISKILFKNINDGNSRHIISSPSCTEQTLINQKKHSHISSINTISGFGDFTFLSSLHDVFVSSRKFPTTPNSCNLNFLKDISRLSQFNLTRLTQNNRCNYHILDNTEKMNTPETTNEELKSVQNDVIADPSSTSIIGTEYIEGERTLLSSNSDEFCNTGSNNHKLNSSQNRNRRSYPLSNVHFDNLLISPEEQFSDVTSDYASCENVHKLLSFNNSLNNTVESKSKIIGKDLLSFANPNYLASISRNPAFPDRLNPNDYVLLNSPVDSVLEDSCGKIDKYEMTEMKPKPPTFLPLLNEDNNGKSSKSVNCRRRECNLQQMYVFFIGGKSNCPGSTYKKPISIFQLSLTSDMY